MVYDVVVVGAGPAGSAAARAAAREGLSVALIDRATFPRDKACGDALIPDALSALDALDVAPRVLAHAATVPGVRVFAPDGSPVLVRGESACVPRVILDETLRQAAVEAGATFLAPLKAIGPASGGPIVTGVRCRDVHSGEEQTILARLTLLATGAATEPLVRFGVCMRRQPSAMAARIYVQVPEAVAQTVGELLISFDASMCPGYGWVFPGPRATFNVGVSYFYDARRLPPTTNLRELLQRFVTTFPPAAVLMRDAIATTPLQGAPLRTGLRGARLARPGLLVIGEAAGLTYSLTGEGIGKAMESGLLAARIAASRLRNGTASVERIADEYEAALRSRYAQVYRAYRRAQTFVGYTAFANWLAERARRNPFVREQLEAMFADTATPRTLLSPTGLVRAWRGSGVSEFRGS